MAFLRTTEDRDRRDMDPHRAAEVRGGLSLGVILIVIAAVVMASWSVRVGIVIALAGLAIMLVGLVALEGAVVKKRR